MVELETKLKNGVRVMNSSRTSNRVQIWTCCCGLKTKTNYNWESWPENFTRPNICNRCDQCASHRVVNIPKSEYDNFYELWRHKDDYSFFQSSNKTMNSLIEGDAQFIGAIEASSWEEALQKKNEYLEKTRCGL